jgi:glycosyltransferase involved in cell wall biosynthesis
MATWNGAAFLEEQLQSILGQTFKDWHLYIRDDGSSDGTTDLIDRCAAEHPSQITVLKDHAGSLGAAGNFSRLMKASRADYILFSDQDDIWLEDRVEVMVSAIRELEGKHSGIPLCVFTDLIKIDDDGTMLAGSLWRDEHLDPGRTAVGQLLVQNVPYGCATIINRPLLELAVPIDPRALLHDHWIALLAASAGEISYIDRTTIRHRIHDANTSRSRNPIRLQRERTAGAVMTNRNFNRYFGQLQEQAAAVKERLLERNYSGEACEVLDDFITLRQKGLLARKHLMIKRKFFKHSAIQTLKWLVRI